MFSVYFTKGQRKLSLISSCAATLCFRVFWKQLEPEASNIYQHIYLDALYTLHFGWKRRHGLLPSAEKAGNDVHFRSCTGRDFSTMAQPILESMTVLEKAA